MHTARYHHVLLRAVPRPCRRALEIGCGTGGFARALASRADHVDAIDRDPDVVDRARAASARVDHLALACADVMTCELPPRAYDFVCALASLHHLPLAEALVRMKACLRPGGVLGVIGLHRADGVAELLASAAAFPISRALRVGRPRPRDDVPLRDPSETLGEIRATVARVLPGAIVARRLLWRYTLLYRAP